MLVQNFESQPVRPPVLIRCAATDSWFVNQALAFFTHSIFSFGCLNLLLFMKKMAFNFLRNHFL
jgi:hypothetical protein